MRLQKDFRCYHILSFSVVWRFSTCWVWCMTCSMSIFGLLFHCLLLCRPMRSLRIKIILSLLCFLPGSPIITKYIHIVWKCTLLGPVIVKTIIRTQLNRLHRGWNPLEQKRRCSNVSGRLYQSPSAQLAQALKSSVLLSLLLVPDTLCVCLYMLRRRTEKRK